MMSDGYSCLMSPCAPDETVIEAHGRLGCPTCYDIFNDALEKLVDGVQDYYRINRAQKSTLYTDHMIYSPGVPWFRTRGTGISG